MASIQEQINWLYAQIKCLKSFLYIYNAGELYTLSQVVDHKFSLLREGVPVIYEVDLSPYYNTNTSEFINDGEDGLNPFITFADIFSGNVAIFKGVQWLGTGLDYRIWWTKAYINLVTYEGLIEGNRTLSDADPNFPRIDVFVARSDTKAFGKVTLTGGGAGDVSSIQVNGQELLTATIPFNTDLQTTAIDIVNNINGNTAITLMYNAMTINGDITIFTREEGNLANGYVVAVVATTITYITTNFAGGLAEGNPSVGVITGFAELSPVHPDLVITEAEISFKLVQAGETAPTTNNVVVYNENIAPPTEWENYGTNPATADLAHTTAPLYSGAVYLKMQSDSTFTVDFRASTAPTIAYDNDHTFNFAMKTSIAWTNQARLRIAVGETGVSSSVVTFNRSSLASYGFDHTILNTWQIVSLPMSIWNSVVDPVNNMFFQFYNAGATVIGIDNAYWQLAATQQPPSTTDQDNIARTIYVTEAQLPAGATVEDRIAAYVTSINYTKLDTDAEIWINYTDNNGSVNKYRIVDTQKGLLNIVAANLYQVTSPPSGAPYYLVAASNTPTKLMNRADYICDGTADDVEILAALALGNVQLMEGTYVLASRLEIPSGREMRGTGKNTIITAPTFTGGFEAVPTATNTMIRNSGGTTGNNITLRNFQLKGTGTPTAYGIWMQGVGSGVGASAIQGVVIEDIYFNEFSSTAIKLLDCHNFKIDHNEFLLCNQDNITLTRIAGEQRSSHGTVIGNLFNSGLAGVFIYYAQDIVIADNVFTQQTEYNMQFDYPRRVVVTGNHCGSTLNIGNIKCTGEASSTDLLISANYFEGGAGIGVEVSNVQRTSILNNIISNTQREGIWIETSDGSTVSGNSIFNGGTLADNTYSGIIALNQQGLKITNNTVKRGTGVNRFSYGLELYGDSTDYTLVANNDFFDSGTSGDILRGSSTHAIRFRSNIANDGSYYGDDFYYTNDLTPPQITASQNDYNPGGLIDAAVLRLDSDAVWSITGLAGGTDGRCFIVHNVGSNNIVLTQEDVLSIATNRFQFTFPLAPDTSIVIRYDGTTQRWRLVSSTSIDPTGLEAINEGNGIGWRLIGRNPANFGNIGLNAVDFSSSTGASTTRGALGTNSLVFGEDITLNSDTNYALVGGYQTSRDEGYGITVGYICSGGGFAAALFGGLQTDAGGNNGYNILGGFGSKGNGYSSAYFGVRLNDDNRRTAGSTTFLGVANEDIGQDFTNNQAEQPMLVVGGGTAGLSYPHSILTKKTILIARRNGEITMPNTTTAIIAGESSGRILVTREYLESVVSATQIGFAASDETTDMAVGEQQFTMRMPYAMTLTDVIITLNEGPYGSTFICDINENGVSILSTLVSIDAEVRATGTVTLTGGASGSVDGITVNGVQIMSAPVAFVTDLPATATAVASNINAFTSSPNYTANAVGAVITITSVNPGASVNGFVVTPTTTTITTSKTDMAGGVTEETSDTAATPVVISDPNLAMNAEITVDVTQVGSINPGVGLKVWFIGNKV